MDDKEALVQVGGLENPDEEDEVADNPISGCSPSDSSESANPYS